MQVLAKYLWSNLTPWLQADANFIAHAPVSAGFDQLPFLAIHVRRGDKVAEGQGDMYTCEVS